ncbi:MAG: dynamin family protein [Candidatus Binatia bacterium]|nr:dynamin family protein [Candidatus Binatia bacterium]
MTQEAETAGMHDAALVARACGLLSTALRESLHLARDLVAEEAAHLPPAALETLDQLLDEFARRRIRIALFGEVKAGKSTLINAIAGRALSPVAFDPLTSVPVHITYGQETTWSVNEHRLQAIEELENFMRTHPFEASEVRVTTPLDLLALGGQVDLLDTPGMGSRERHFDSVTEEILQALDAVVLVVRYPGLFTRFTHELVERLDGRISKLFVVWNLDRGCIDLSETERRHFARQLSDNVGMTHELHLVDARTAFERAHDPEARRGSGIDTFVAALREFAASNARDVAALREAAKAGVRWFADVLPALELRLQTVEQYVREARAAVSAVQQEGENELAEARKREAQFEASIQQLVQRRAKQAHERGARLLEEIHAARRRWMRNGHLLKLERAVATAVSAFVNDMHSLAREIRDELVTATAAFGADLSLSIRARQPLEVGRLAPEDRNVRANSGSFKILRRAVWNQWYLPGLVRFERETLKKEMQAVTAWLQSGAQAAVQAGQSTTAQRLRRIAERTAERVEQLREAKQLDAYEEEYERLRQGVPGLKAEVEHIERLAEQARDLLQAAR